jgi:hypothetical protein
VAATLGTAIAAVGALTYTAQTAHTAEQGQYTDRFTKAVEQLASDKINVRLGGIYAMERLASDSERDRGAITEVLSSYLRQRFPEADSPQCHAAPAPPRLAADIRTVFTVLGRRTDADKKATPTDLSGICPPVPTDLRGLNLAYANLSGARLDHQLLPQVNLTGANLFRTGLDGANLDHAVLIEADLTEADLRNTNLTGTDLSRTLTDSARFEGANLTDAVGTP